MIALILQNLYRLFNAYLLPNHPVYLSVLNVYGTRTGNQGTGFNLI